jgi:hypothetical protein
MGVSTKGSVFYGESLDSMTVIHSSAAQFTTMWGADNLLSGGKEDWRSVALVVNEIKNEMPAADRYKLKIGGDPHPEVINGAVYYLRSKAGDITAQTSPDGFFDIPANFDGYVLIPKYAFPDGFDFSKTTRFSFEFNAAAGVLTFGFMGYAKSDKALFPNDFELNIIDDSKYLDEKYLVPQPPEEYPERVSTEPATEAERSGETPAPASGSCGTVLGGGDPPAQLFYIGAIGAAFIVAVAALTRRKRTKKRV